MTKLRAEGFAINVNSGSYEILVYPSSALRLIQIGEMALPMLENELNETKEPSQRFKLRIIVSRIKGTALPDIQVLKRELLMQQRQRE